MSGSPLIRIPRSCDEYCDSLAYGTGERCAGGHYVEVAFSGTSDTARVQFDDRDPIIFSVGKWVAMITAAALVAETRAELSSVTAEYLVDVVADPYSYSIDPEYRSRHTGELL